MGQILGLGITHYPPLCYKGNLTRRIKLLQADPLLPEHLRTPAGWPPTMREQWGTDEGQSHSEKHRSDLIHHFRRIRAELDAFEPDFVLLWGDDQYENYQEDCVPPFSVLAYESVDIQPWQGHQRGRELVGRARRQDVHDQGPSGRRQAARLRRSWRKGSTSLTPTSPSTIRSVTPS